MMLGLKRLRRNCNVFENYCVYCSRTDPKIAVAYNSASLAADGHHYRQRDELTTKRT